MTNAIVHSGSPYIGLTIGHTADGDLHLSVADEGKGGTPALGSTRPDQMVKHGRGLWFVDTLAKRWGVERAPVFGQIVWLIVGQQPPPTWFDVLTFGER